MSGIFHIRPVYRKPILNSILGTSKDSTPLWVLLPLYFWASKCLEICLNKEACVENESLRQRSHENHDAFCCLYCSFGIYPLSSRIILKALLDVNL